MYEFGYYEFLNKTGQLHHWPLYSFSFPCYLLSVLYM